MPKGFLRWCPGLRSAPRFGARLSAPQPASHSGGGSGEYLTRIGRLDVTSTFEGVGEVEVPRAASRRVRGRAPGPDGLPALPPLVALLFTTIL